MCQTLLASNYLMMMVMIMILHDTSVHDTTHQTEFRKVPTLALFALHMIRIIRITVMTMIIKQSSQWCFLISFCGGHQIPNTTSTLGLPWPTGCPSPSPQLVGHRPNDHIQFREKSSSCSMFLIYPFFIKNNPSW